MSKTKSNDDKTKATPSGPGMLPIVTIKGRRYFVDERLREYER